MASPLQILVKCCNRAVTCTDDSCDGTAAAQLGHQKAQCLRVASSHVRVFSQLPHCLPPLPVSMFQVVTVSVPLSNIGLVAVLDILTLIVIQQH